MSIYNFQSNRGNMLYFLKYAYFNQKCQILKYFRSERKEL